MTLVAEPEVVAVVRPSDADLLAAVARCGDRSAHGELVRRYLDFVYAAAVRRLGDRHAAEDVGQAVFLLLAKKAGAIHARALPAWLHRATQYTAANAERAGRRRRLHERQAARAEAAMPDTPDDTDALRPLLDAAIDSLGHRDRQAVIERYLLGHDFAAVGASLGLSAGSAQKRVERAVGKLRRRFARAGVPAGAAAVTAALVAAAPSPASAAPLAVTVALSQSLSASSAVPASAVVGKGVLAMTVGTKIKIAAAAAVALLLAGGVGVAVFQAVASGPTPPTPPAAAPIAAPPTSLPGALSGTLKDGTIVDVGLIGDHERNEWWTPDGQPAEMPPFMDRFIADRRPAPAGKRWVWVSWRFERPGTPPEELWGTAVPEPVVNSSMRVPFPIGGERTWVAEKIAVDANRATIDWKVLLASKPAQQVVLDRPADGVWRPDTSVTQTVPGFGQVSIRNPREMRFNAEKEGFGAAFDRVVPRIGDSTNWNMTLADANGRTNWAYTADPPTSDPTVRTRAESVPLKDVARVTLSLNRYDEWVHFRNLPLGPGVPVGGPPHVETHDPPAAVAAGAKLTPFTDLRFVGDVPQVLVNDIWWEWITLDGRPITDVIADAKRLDERQWRKRLGEDLVDVMAAGGFEAGPTASIGLRSLDGVSTTTGNLPMSTENRRLVRERRAERERAAEGQPR